MKTFRALANCIYTVFNRAAACCPVCRTKSTYAFTSKHKRDVYACANNSCGHLWLPRKRPSQGLHQINPVLSIESNYNLSKYGARNKRLLTVLLKSIENNKAYPLSFLDFGAGCAHVSRSFKTLLGDRVNIYCIEGNADALKFYPDWDLLPLKSTGEIPDGSLDLIYLIEVIEHLDDPEDVLSHLRNKLKPGGRIFISTPEGKLEENKTNAYDNATHVHFFTEASLDCLLSNCKLSKMQYIDRCVMHPRPGDENLVNAFDSSLITSGDIELQFGKPLERSERSGHHLVGFVSRLS